MNNGVGFGFVLVGFVVYFKFVGDGGIKVEVWIFYFKR
jgi:hypothetical protein